DRRAGVDAGRVMDLRQGQARAVDVLRGGGRAAAVVGRREVGGVVVGAAVGEGRVRRHVDDDAGAARQGDRAAGQDLAAVGTADGAAGATALRGDDPVDEGAGPTRQVVADGGARGGARAGVGEGDREADRRAGVDAGRVMDFRQGQARAVDVLRGGCLSAAVLRRRYILFPYATLFRAEGRVRRHVDDDAGAARQGDRA